MAERTVAKMDRSELQTELLELRKEQFNLRMQKGSGQLTNPARFMTVRRKIARIKTRMTQLAEM